MTECLKDHEGNPNNQTAFQNQCYRFCNLIGSIRCGGQNTAFVTLRNADMPLVEDDADQSERDRTERVLYLEQATARLMNELDISEEDAIRFGDIIRPGTGLNEMNPDDLEFAQNFLAKVELLYEKLLQESFEDVPYSDNEVRHVGPR